MKKVRRAKKEGQVGEGAGVGQGPGAGGILKGLAALTTIGVTLVASTFAGLFIGLYLDRVFSTKPYLTIIFLVLGIIAGFRNIYYIVKRYAKDAGGPGGAGEGRAEGTGGAEGTRGPGFNFGVAALRVGRVSVFAGLVLTLIASWLKRPFAAGFGAGYMIGFANVIWLLRIISRGLNLPGEKAVRFVLSRYYIRLAATAAVVAILALKEVFSSLPLIAGLAASFFITIVAMIFVLRKEFFANA